MSGGHLTAMSNAAFAGFLRLVLTPLNEKPECSDEVKAYLDYLSMVEGRSAPAAHLADATDP